MVLKYNISFFFILINCFCYFVYELHTLTEFNLFSFLLQSPQDRLGCNPETGFDDIQSHPFFRVLDFDALYAKQIAPPYKPQVRGERDLVHFDPTFIKEPVVLTPDDP